MQQRGRGKKLRSPEEAQTPSSHPLGALKAGLLRGRSKRVFNIDIETYRECRGTVKVIARIEDPMVINQILDHLKNKTETNEPKTLPESRAPLAGLPQGLLD